MDPTLVKDHESILPITHSNDPLPPGLSPANLVDFNGVNDPEDPYNWSAAYKWSMVILISTLSLIVQVESLQPLIPLQLTNPQKPRHLDVRPSHLLHPLRIPYHQSPARHPPRLHLGTRRSPRTGCRSAVVRISRPPAHYHAANTLFIALTIAAANSTSMGMLITLRFFLGMSVASTVINPCIVGDLFREAQRGRALALMGMIPFIAPCLGPTIGGFVAQARGWRWTFWVTAIVAAPLQLVFAVFYRETYRVRILAKKAARLMTETGNAKLRSIYEVELVATRRMVRAAVLRPLKMLLGEMAVLLVGIMGAVNMSLVYVIITSISDVYEHVYGFEKRFLGLTFFGLGVGMVLSAVTIGPFLDHHMASKHKLGKANPKHRIPPMLLGGVLTPCDMLAFGWSVEYRIHWVAPILFSVLVGYGFVAVAISAWSYLVDRFGIYAASATAGTVILRNAGAATLPLAGPSLVARVGMGWGYSVLALIGMITVPIPVVLRWIV